jgi:transcriptional regulator with XRE-family HTH domain
MDTNNEKDQQPMDPQTLQALNKAISFIKHKGLINKNEDIATATKISPSSLSGYLNGSKNPPEEWFQKFEEVYNLQLNNPITYTDIEGLGIDARTGLNVTTFLDTYSRMLNLIKSKEEQIISLQNALNAAIRENQTWMDIYKKYESVIVAARIKEASGEKEGD